MKLSTATKSTIVTLAVAVVLAFVAVAEYANAAGVTTAGMQVVGTVSVRCSVGVGTLHFPSTYVSGQAAPLDATTSIIVNCDPGRRVSVKISEGLNKAPGSSRNNPLRRLRNGAYYLNYNIYEDAARTTIWDDRQNAARTTRVFPYTAWVYGRIAGSQTAYPGTYSDTVVVTIHY